MIKYHVSKPSCKFEQKPFELMSKSAKKAVTSISKEIIFII